VPISTSGRHPHLASIISAARRPARPPDPIVSASPYGRTPARAGPAHV
jgi:hypothetical protein